MFSKAKITLAKNRILIEMVEVSYIMDRDQAKFLSTVLGNEDNIFFGKTVLKNAAKDKYAAVAAMFARLYAYSSKNPGSASAPLHIIRAGIVHSLKLSGASSQDEAHSAANELIESIKKSLNIS